MERLQAIDNNTEIKIALGKTLKEHRLKKGLSQAAVAIKAFGPEASKTQVAHYERGRYLPQAANLHALAEVLEISWSVIEEILHPSNKSAIQERSRYRSIAAELRLGQHLTSIRLGQPFSWRLLWFSMTLSQIYSMTIMLVVWLFIPEVHQFASLGFLPDWAFGKRALLVAWSACLICLIIYEVGGFSRSTQSAIVSQTLMPSNKTGLFWLVPLWLAAICLALWTGSSVGVTLLSTSVVLYAWHQGWISSIFTTFILVSVTSFCVCSQIFPHYDQLISAFYSGAMSALIVSMLAKRLRFSASGKLQRTWIALVILAVCISMFPYANQLGSGVQIAVGLIPVMSFAFALVYFSTAQDDNYTPFSRLGILIFSCALLISLSWPSVLRDSSSSAVWPIFFVVLPAVNALCDFLSLSCTLNSLRFLSRQNSTRMGSANGLIIPILSSLKGLLTKALGTFQDEPISKRIARITTVIVFELFSVITIFLALMLLIHTSFYLVDNWVSGSFSSIAGLEQHSNIQSNSGAWLQLMLLTVFAPTLVCVSWMFFFATRSPGGFDESSEQSIRIKFDLLRMKSERSYARLWLAFFGIALFYLADFGLALASGTWVSNLLWFMN